jgi:hypothetical protein
MFYQEDQINPALICPHCTNRLHNPCFLPCGVSCCQNCILELMLANETQNKEFKCESCDSTHQEPNGGFKIIKNFAILLEQKPNEVWRGYGVKNLEEYLDLIQSKLERITTQHSTSLIQEHCANLKNEIDLQTDTLKNKLDDQRENLFTKIDEYEKSCIGNVEKIQNDDEYLKLVKEMSAFRTQWVEYLKSFKIDEKEISKAIRFCYEKLTSIEKFKDSNVLFDEQRRLRFRANEENNIDLGELVIEKTKTALFPCFEQTNEINLSLISPSSSVLLVEPMQNGRFLIVSVISSCVHLKIISADGKILNEHNKFKSYLADNIRICLNDNLIFLYRFKNAIPYTNTQTELTLDSLNHDLFNKNSIILSSEIFSMTSNDSSLFVWDKSEISVYDTQLICKRTIKFNSNHLASPSYLPNPTLIKCIKVKLNKLYILSEGYLAIFEISSWIRLQKFPINATSFGFYSDKIIAGLSQNKISFYSDRGVHIRDVELKVNKDFYLSVNSHKIAIFDKNKLIF